MDTQLHNSLMELGLNDKEANIYIKLLSKGACTASEIAKITKLNRATTYVVLEHLEKLGLVATIEDSKVREFVANHPRNLQNLVSKAEDEAKKRRDILDTTVPKLIASYSKNTDGPVVRYFSGKENIESSARELIMQIPIPNEPNRLIFSFNLLPNVSEKYLEESRKYREDNNIKTLSIVEGKQTVKDIPGRTLINISTNSNHLPIKADIEVFGDRVFMANYENDYRAVLIIDEAIATTMKTLHKLAVIGAKQLKENPDLINEIE